MRITLAQIEALYWTARLGTMRAAAQKLHVTQPSLSLRIRELEKNLGVPIFHRAGRGMHLSHHGASLRRHCEQIIALAQEIEQHGRIHALETPTLIRIGAVDIFAMTTLSQLLSVLERSHPNLNVEVNVAFSHVIMDMLESGKLDLAFLTNVSPGESYSSRFIANVPIAWMAAHEHNLHDRTLDPTDLAKYQVFTNPAPSHLYNSIHSWFQTGNAWPRRVNTCNTLSVIAQLTAGGNGVTLLPSAMQKIDIWGRQLHTIQVTPAMNAHRLFALHRRGTESPQMEDVISEAAALVLQSGYYD